MNLSKSKPIMNNAKSLLVAVALTATSPLLADVLELKNGTVLNGKYVGGTAGTVRFEALGSIQVLATSDIVALTFTSSGATAAAPAATAPVTQAAPPAAAAPTTPQKVTLPTGTMLLVRMKDGVSSKNNAGTPFASKLEYDLFMDGVKAIPAGTLIYGKVQSSTQARRARGQSTLDLRLTQIVAGASTVSITTSSFEEAGERAIKDAARGAAAGAAIGAIVDGGDGAGTGAAIGATVGALKRGETITIPPGTLIEFKLTQPCTLSTGG
jgi:hypothetical protein